MFTSIRFVRALDFAFREDPKDVLWVLLGRRGLQRLVKQVRRERYRFFRTGRLHYEQLGRWFGVSPQVIRELAEEAASIVSTIAQQWPAEEGNLGHLKGALALYVVTRLAKPEIMVETGVAAGISSAFALDAMDRNGKGILYSIDVKNYDHAHIPEEMPTGAMIPANLRHRWKLVQGNSRRLLRELLVEVDAIDVFLHDSLHTREQMLWEYTVAWEALRVNGLLLSDNVEQHKAFQEFCAGKKAPFMLGHSVWRGPHLGIARKMR
jgi:predicted O-methyltransferase YrrM